VTYVRIEKPRPHVSVVRMDRPERMNSMAFELVVPLHEALAEVAADNDTRCVILTGTGRGFLQPPGVLGVARAVVDKERRAVAASEGFGVLSTLLTTLPYAGLWVLVSLRLPHRDAPLSLIEIARGKGQIVTLQGKQLAVYRDTAGRVHTLSPTCTHAGCIVQWNGTERSWDCPCHGSRFAPTGDVLSGPAEKPLPAVE